VSTIDTSQLSDAPCPGPGCIASSDPSGITFLAPWDSLLVTDSEVEEIPTLFTGDNLFEITTSGLLLRTLSTVSFSNEPTGVTWNPAGGRLLFSDDAADEIFELDPGPDGLFGTPDDVATTILDTRDFLSFDPEGVTIEASTGSGTVCSVATQDAYFHQDAPDHSHGTGNDLKVKPDVDKLKHSVLEFDLSAIPAGSRVVSSSLLLWEDDTRDNQRIHVHRVTSGWVESGVSWEERNPGTAWTTPGGDFDSAALASFEPIIENQYREIDVTGVTQAWVNGTFPNHGLLLRSTGANGEVKFKSREEGNEEKRPLICVDYETSTTLWIADGVGARVYRVTPGPNGAFDGVAPLGDDEFTSFDTAGDGLTDIEGIAFNSENRYLYVVGRPVGMLAEYTTQGELVRLFDISAASPLLPSGLTFAPGSLDPSVPNIYITDRRVDNQTDPEENDGRIYEMSLPEVTPGNHRPLVDAGPDQLIKFPVESISLNGTVVDDGLPNPPGAPTITWRQVSGPGTVSFAKASSADTVASFSAPGTYVLRLAANDGELVASDDVTITVLGLNGEIVVEIRVAKGSDDAEERFDGDVAIGSVDIEMVDTPEGGGGNETVGYRFEGVPVPPGSEIVRGYVQFKADESHDVATYLTIYGEKVGDSATFVQDGGGGAGISSRPKTAASISWSPPPWTAGQVGPAQRTPDIAPILQEVVDQLEWVDGNALTILIDGQGKRVADSADGNPFAPLLHLEFIPPAPPSCVVTGEGSFNVDDGGKELREW
jgi:sugar lactone lactonase YvrE